MTSHLSLLNDISDEEDYLPLKYPNSGITSKQINRWTCDTQDIADAGPSKNSPKTVSDIATVECRNLSERASAISLNESSASLSSTTCLQCSRNFKNNMGLKIHTGRVHHTQSRKCSIAESFPEPPNVPLHSQLAKLKGSLRILKRIPKATRPLAADALSKVINSCIKENTLGSWSNLLLFAYKCFYVSRSSGEKKNFTFFANKEKHFQLK